MKSLNINYTTVSDTGLLALRKGLPELTEFSADSAGFTDAAVETLSAMTGLKTLNLYHTLVTYKGFTALKAALPKCQIVYDRDSSLPNRRHS